MVKLSGEAFKIIDKVNILNGLMDKRAFDFDSFTAADLQQEEKLRIELNLIAARAERPNEKEADNSIRKG